MWNVRHVLGRGGQPRRPLHVVERKDLAQTARSHPTMVMHAFRVLLATCIALINLPVDAGASSASQVDRGRYLAAAGNCVSCHTAEDGQAFAGGVEFATPFGTLYSTNITPDPQTGIGNWTQQQFARALREGVRPSGEHLYPAFPYTAFTRISDEDIAALFAYLRSLQPVTRAGAQNRLRFPFNQRWTIGLWKSLYFEAGRFVPDERQTAQWNRGAYLVQGPGHCSMCHSPRTWLGGEDAHRAMSGGTYRDNVAGKVLEWSASNLTSAPDGLASWSVAEVASYLKLGFSARAGVFGPMNEVVVNSTRHLSDQDVSAISTYLKSIPASSQLDSPSPEQSVMSEGQLQYDIHCGTCHLPTGLGSDTTGPPLAGSSIVLAADPASLINVTLYGAQLPSIPPSKEWQMRQWQPMEPFGDKLSDAEAAALLTYIRSAWSNKAGAVRVGDVAKQR